MESKEKYILLVFLNIVFIFFVSERIECLKEGCEKYFKVDDWYIKYELGKHH